MMQSRKQKRDAKNARHRANEQRRWNRKVDKWFGSWLIPELRQCLYEGSTAGEWRKVCE